MFTSRSLSAAQDIKIDSRLPSTCNNSPFGFPLSFSVIVVLPSPLLQHAFGMTNKHAEERILRAAWNLSARELPRCDSSDSWRGPSKMSLTTSSIVLVRTLLLVRPGSYSAWLPGDRARFLFNDCDIVYYYMAVICFPLFLFFSKVLFSYVFREPDLYCFHYIYDVTQYPTSDVSE